MMVLLVIFMEYSGRDCKEDKCLWTTNECYETLFGKSGGN